MFSCGEKVVYGMHGVCRILDIETKTVDRKKVQYYVLQPIEQDSCRYYVPVNNPVAAAKLRPIMTVQELEAILKDADAQEDVWIEDENQRKQYYRQLVATTDKTALICMVRALYMHKDKQLAAGRKFHLCDENFLRDAKKLLDTEFAITLNIQPADVEKYVQNILGGNK